MGSDHKVSSSEYIELIFIAETLPGAVFSIEDDKLFLAVVLLHERFFIKKPYIYYIYIFITYIYLLHKIRVRGSCVIKKTV
jgi:hypothetical protein